MRFESSVLFAREVPVALREIELASTLVEVVAPRDWTSAQIEAWLAWADRTVLLGHEDELSGEVLNGALAAYADRITDKGRALDLFDDEESAANFRSAVLASLAQGLAAPAARARVVRVPSSYSAVEMGPAHDCAPSETPPRRRLISASS